MSVKYILYNILMACLSSNLVNTLESFSNSPMLWRLPLKRFNGESMLFSEKGKERQFKCCEAVPSEFCVEPREDKKVIKRKNLMPLIMRDYIKEMQAADISDKIMKKALHDISCRIAILGIKRVDGTRQFITGYAKGTERYNKKMKFKIIDTVKELVKLDGETLALTITYDIKRYGKNQFAAWKNYTKHINKVLENLRKHKGAKYVWIKESTAKGYPHAHIIISLPKGSVKGWDKLKNGAKLFYGSVFDEIKKRVRSKIFRLEVVKGDNLKYYLTKYVSKFSEEDIFKLSEKKEGLTTEERKAIFCLLGTIATHTRQFGFTKISFE
ncbi:MAG: hypothetical protein ACI4VW_00510, partial [Acutalibacteraceae bacterium]